MFTFFGKYVHLVPNLFRFIENVHIPHIQYSCNSKLKAATPPCGSHAQENTIGNKRHQSIIGVAIPCAVRGRSKHVTGER